MKEEGKKDLKIIIIFLIILVVILIVIISLILFNKDDGDTTIQQDTNIETSSTITLNYTKNDECISYTSTLDELTYGNIAVSDYGNTLYYTYMDDDYAYYLVCLTDLSVTIEDETTDLYDAIYAELITTEEFNNLLVQEELTNYVILVPVDNSAEAVEETEDSLDY